MLPQLVPLQVLLSASTFIYSDDSSPSVLSLGHSWLALDLSFSRPARLLIVSALHMCPHDVLNNLAASLFLTTQL